MLPIRTTLPRGLTALLLCWGTLVFSLSALAAPDGPPNPGFEQGLSGWGSLWTREEGKGSAAADTGEAHGGRASLRIDHQGMKDWSLEAREGFAVTPGELVEISAWAKIVAKGADPADLVLCVSTADSSGKVQDWDYGARRLLSESNPPTEWTPLKSRFLIPQGITKIRLRFIGGGLSQCWIDDVSLVRQGRVADLHGKSLSLSNPLLSVTFDTATAALNVLDKRTGETFSQNAFPDNVAVLSAAPDGEEGLRCTLLHASSGLTLEALIRLDPTLPECTVELSSKGEEPLDSPIRYPAPFLSKPGQYLVVPLNEGISYPVEDPAIEPMRLVAYGGHGICMAFWGLTDGERGQMTILETPDDAAIRIARHDGKLDVSPEWESQKKRFGYTRRLRYIFFDQGGHVAMAKRYRAYAQKIGLFKTLEQKRKENPNVDLLVGAVNVWFMDSGAVPVAKEMKAAGIDRMLWSGGQTPENLKALNDLGLLTSRYDIYQDVMDPAQFPRLKYIHKDWPAAWPDDIVLDEKGNWVHGWEVETKEGGMQACGVLNDTLSVKYAKQRVPAELATHPYRCRFIDTTTASGWREDYNPLHPMTRSECRAARMALLNYMSGECHLVTGSETGHDAAVPFLHYFEGMLSLTPYRVPDSGRDMSRIWTEVPEKVAKFQVGEGYRLPLWELVYHECVVAQWYWGDYNNKLPALWDKRDLFNLLYGTPPMFLFNRPFWEKNKERFVQSYRNVAPIVRAVGYSEMVDHRFLTLDRCVQQTTFANGTVVTVNFGGIPYRGPGGTLLAPMGFRIDQKN